jgi:ferric-dicitrate binding protein FerR (iron transport regulator)
MKFLPKTVDSQFLVRVIRNEVGIEEREFFERWLEETEDHKEEFSSLVLLWEKFQSSHLPPLPAQQEQWKKIELSIADVSLAGSAASSAAGYKKSYYSSYSSAARKSYRNDLYSWIYRIAAVIIIGISLSLINNSIERNNNTSDKAAVSQTPIDIIYYTLLTGKGEKATFQLADGSEIQLNAESKLIYPNYFEDNSREVEFEGEGYFTIHPDKNRPFRVRCNNTVTEVTGTEFNIRNRDDKVAVTVIKGSVKTFSSRSVEGVAVEKGQMVLLKSTGSFTNPFNVNVKIYWHGERIK